jgi:hypothetical protein
LGTSMKFGYTQDKLARKKDKHGHYLRSSWKEWVISSKIIMSSVSEKILRDLHIHQFVLHALSLAEHPIHDDHWSICDCNDFVKFSPHLKVFELRMFEDDPRTFRSRPTSVFKQLISFYSAKRWRAWRDFMKDHLFDTLQFKLVLINRS